MKNLQRLIASLMLAAVVLATATACTEENVQPSSDIKSSATITIRD
jgi:hypothetical protein